MSLFNFFKSNFNKSKENIDTDIEKKIVDLEDINEIYKEYDMSEFSSDNFNWKESKRDDFNNYIIQNYQWLSKIVNNDLKKVYELCKENKIKLPVVKRNMLESQNLDKLPTYSFTPFTPTGKVKKVVYKVSFDTYIKNKKEYHYMDESWKFERDLYPFGSIELGKDQSQIRSRYIFWEKSTKYEIFIDVKNKVSIVKKISKHSMKDIELGKPEILLYTLK